MRLYTIDVNPDLLDAEPDQPEATCGKEEKQQLANKVFKSGGRKPVEWIHRDPDIANMREPYEYNEDFYESFNEGYRLYLDGKFTQACLKLDKALQILPNDGPTATLKAFMEGDEGKGALADWKGYRELLEK